MSFLKCLLLPLSALYYLAISLRNYLYERGFVQERSLAGKVVSIGNLTLGGTGKTPLVEYIAKLLQKNGWKIAILSRGYARRESVPLTLVSNGKEILVGVNKAGDEPLLLAKNLPGILVVVDKDRHKSGLLAQDNFGANLFILDDGFQYRKLKKEMNILAINGKNPFGNGWLFPAGVLREPINSLKRADAIVILETSTDHNNENIRQVIAHYKPNLSIFHCFRSPIGFFFVAEDKALPAGFFKRRKIICLSAIAHPAAFEEDLKEMGFSLIKKYHFTDHHHYNQSEVDNIAAVARQTEAEAIITTQKDALRLQGLREREPPLIYLKIEMRIQEEKEFKKFLFNSLAS